MSEAVRCWPLRGVLAVVLGFVLRLNPALVVVVAGFVTGFAAKLSPLEVLDILGKAFTEKRFLLLFLIGLELQPSRLWVLRRLVFGLGATQVFITGVVIAVIAIITLLAITAPLFSKWVGHPVDELYIRESIISPTARPKRQAK